MLDTVGKRLKEARKYSGITQVELADAIDAKQGAISDLENGRNSTSTKLVQMALALGVNAEWLSTGVGEMVNVSKDAATPAPHMIPVLSLTEALDLLVKNDETITVSKFEPVRGDYDSPESLYWIRIQDSSMSPAFNPPDLVLINTNLSPQSGDYVLGFDKESETVMLRKWQSGDTNVPTDKPYSQLVAINLDYPTIDSRSNDFNVLGVAVEHRIKLR